ncbi:hypothetical protein DY000_02010613 [Brassica cretica]|uniref:Uncharacterized protein n=1 Tax=Brassica cretica TaxID=69181 RepID=A0ABQ7BYS6_BRACR|nr:hypothetical protein DY000_02010613 [Brassica cretica]
MVLDYTVVDHVALTASCGFAFVWKYRLDNISLGVVLVDILEESNSATELLRFLDIWLIVFMEQDPVSAPRASASEIELDAIIGGGRLVDPSCFTSSLEFVSASLGFRELDSSRDFCVAFGRLWWFDLDRGAIEMLLRSRNVRIVKWKIREHLEILRGSIVLRRWRSNKKSHRDDMTFSSLVLSKPSASSVFNGTSVLVNEFDIVIVIEELEDRNEMVCHQLEILLRYVRNGREPLPSDT